MPVFWAMKYILPLNTVLATALAFGAVADEPTADFESQPFTLQPNALSPTWGQFLPATPFLNAPVALKFQPIVPYAKVPGTVVLGDPAKSSEALPAPGLYLSRPYSMIVKVPQVVEWGGPMAGSPSRPPGGQVFNKGGMIEKPAILVPLRR